MKRGLIFILTIVATFSLDFVAFAEQKLLSPPDANATGRAISPSAPVSGSMEHFARGNGYEILKDTSYPAPGMRLVVRIPACDDGRRSYWANCSRAGEEAKTAIAVKLGSKYDIKGSVRVLKNGKVPSRWTGKMVPSEVEYILIPTVNRPPEPLHRATPTHFYQNHNNNNRKPPTRPTRD